MITQTHIGKAIITHPHLVTLTGDTGSQGSIALGILLDSDGRPQCWCLFWEWGGDWMGFEENDQYDKECLVGWEPQAVKDAIKAAIEAQPDCEEDMEWFESWGETAAALLSRYLA